MKKCKNLDERHLYEDCWNGKWKCNFANLEQLLDISIVLFSFLAQKNIKQESNYYSYCLC